MNYKGFSLAESLIAMGVGIIVALGIMTLLTSQQRETRAIIEKLAATELEKTLSVSLGDGAVCTYLANNPAVLTFDSTLVTPGTPQIITPTLPIYASVSPGAVLGPIVAQVGAAPSALTANLIVDTITLSISEPPSPLPAPGPGATFKGNWIITFDNTNLVRAIRPVTVATILTVDTTVPGAAVITKCQATAASLPKMIGAGDPATDGLTGNAACATIGKTCIYV